MYLAKFGTFPIIISLNNFLAPSFFFPSGTLMTQMLDLFLWFHKSKFLFNFASLFFLCCKDWVISIFLLCCCFSPMSSSPPPIPLLSPSTEIAILVFVFSVLKLPFGSSLCHLFLCWDSLLFAWDFLVFICFKRTSNCSLKHFYHGYLKLFVR